MKISPARIAAFDVLLKIEKEKAYSSILLPKYEDGLDGKDRGLCHGITLGVLRRRIYLDAIIAQLSGGRKIDPEVAIALRIGLFQLLFLEKIPDYSAVTESVNLVQRARKASAKSFVNALLRRVSRENIGLSFADDLERLSVETSHPKWLIEKWSRQFGVDNAAAIAEANNEIPTTSFRITAKGKRNGVALPDHARESAFVEGCYLTAGPREDLLKLADAGEIYFQDEASQMVAASVEISEGGSFLDVCAAPGSKTSMIAAPDTAVIVAGDLHESRVRFLRDNCGAQGVGNVQIVRYDAETSLPFGSESFDSVLVDAPCSGTGTIQNNPEIRYFLEPGDFAALHRKQLAILENASKLVKRGGTLVYSTCSLENEENEEVIAAFLSGNDAFGSQRPRLNERFLTADGFARTFPHRDEMDGFFIAGLRRRAGLER